MTVILVLIGWLVPHASGLIGFAVVPMAVVAHRHRPRAVVASAVAAVTVAFLVAGTGPAPTVGLCAVVGGIAGQARRRGWRWPAVIASALVAGPALGALADLALLALGPLRRLTISNLRDTWDGYARLLETVRPLRVYVRPITEGVHEGLRLWWALVPGTIVLVVLVATWATWYYTRGLLLRLDRMPVEDRLAPSPTEEGRSLGSGDGESLEPPQPVPTLLEDVVVRYPGSSVDALGGVSLEVPAGERTVVLGPNGSGKSTLARVLAGRSPSSGRVLRAGPVGLGRPGGTAFVSQHPEAQVLGVRVADDLVWGLPARWEVDTDVLLSTVGLAGLGARETSTLSGGQLQRLALAAALARRPVLLVADEITAMVDSSGRDEIVSLLRRLPAEQGVSVVQITHRLEEVAGADRLYRLGSGRLVAAPLPSTAQPSTAQPGTTQLSTPSCGLVGPGSLAGSPQFGSHVPPGAEGSDRPVSVPAGPGSAAHHGDAFRCRRPSAVEEILVVDRVSHTYADRTPWAETALRDLSLSVRSGEGLLVVGDNGSGKSTLAWVMAGLLRPTEGECRLRGTPVHRQVGSVALAFQHARLQVQGSTVGGDLRAAAGVDRAAGEEALALLGLDGALLWDRPVDALSGGQLRRVALAGLLASAPEVLLLDEPLAGLDEESREALLAALADLRCRRDR
ncbi:MAG: ABC transporter ATP-binding protein, partial [Actinomycetota bacterium]|nr:ABC transporter ATP-binding protein [Actinomycetota bacterium]